MKVSDTCVKTVGAYRCCLEAPEQLKTAEYGDSVVCKACGTVLTLVDVPGQGPVWMSEGQIQDMENDGPA